jgi:radical SAM protein with 4Fe4S-binding SPASM domain
MFGSKMKLEWDNKALSLECGHPKVADQEQFVSNLKVLLWVFRSRTNPTNIESICQVVNTGCVFLIGNEIFINSMNINGTSMSNTGAQTVFLMPNGDMVMPNYDEFNNIEFMQKFGNILKQSFEKILTSKSRRRWIRRQINRNNNKECMECDSWNCCLMEFWKNNNKDDDCYGAKKYVEWVKKHSTQEPTFIENIS